MWLPECYLVYLVFPGLLFRSSDFVCVCDPKMSAFLKLKLLKTNNFHLEMLPGPAPVLVTWLAG